MRKKNVCLGPLKLFLCFLMNCRGVISLYMGNDTGYVSSSFYSLSSSLRESLFEVIHKHYNIWRAFLVKEGYKRYCLTPAYYHYKVAHTIRERLSEGHYHYVFAHTIRQEFQLQSLLRRIDS